MWKALSFKMKTWLALGIVFVITTLSMTYSVLTIRYISNAYESKVNGELKVKDEVRILLTKLLEARKDEKYFIIKKDEKYLSSFKKNIESIRDEISRLKEFDTEVISKEEIETIDKLVTSYSNGFNDVVSSMNEEVENKKKLSTYSDNIRLGIEDYYLSDVVTSEYYYIINQEGLYFLGRDEKIFKNLIFYANQLKPSLTKELKKEKIEDNTIESILKNVDDYISTIESIHKNEQQRNELITSYETAIGSIEKQVNNIVSKASNNVRIAISEMSKLKRNIIVISIASSVLTILVILFVTAFYISSAKRIEDYIKSLREDAATSNESSKKLATISDELSSGVNQQSSAILETVSTLDEMKEMMRRSLENIEYADKTASEGNKTMAAGKESVTKVVESINDISQCNDDITKQMENVSNELNQIVDAIKDISTKTEVINDIVFQTKLLSFNASVEAARAGEHGKGFAVVAEEVGNLATMSGNAATEIEGLIAESVQKVETIVAQSKSKVDSLVSTAKDKTDDGLKRAQTCDEVFSDLVTNVSKVRELMEGVSEAAKEQSTGVQNISEAMNELDNATHINTEAANKTAGFASEIASQSDDLAKVVGSLENIFLGYLKDRKTKSLELKKESVNKSVNSSQENTGPHLSLVNNDEKENHDNDSMSTEISHSSNRNDMSVSNTSEVSHNSIASTGIPSRDDDRFEDI